MTGAMYGVPMSDRDGEPNARDRLTVSEISDVLQISRDAVRYRLQHGQIPGRKDADGTWLAYRDQVEAYKHSQLNTVAEQIEAEMGDYHHRIEAARQVVNDLIDERNRALYARYERGHSVPVLARAAHMGRQNLYTVLREVRAQLAEEAARRGEVQAAFRRQ